MIICDGCRTVPAVTISMFGDDPICLECLAIERMHPDYERAWQAELESSEGRTLTSEASASR